jgi:hypothetical protein
MSFQHRTSESYFGHGYDMQRAGEPIAECYEFSEPNRTWAIEGFCAAMGWEAKRAKRKDKSKSVIRAAGEQ